MPRPQLHRLFDRAVLLTTQLNVDLLQFGSAEAASEAFDEPLAREVVEGAEGKAGFITPFIIPAEPVPPGA